MTNTQALAVGTRVRRVRTSLPTVATVMRLEGSNAVIQFDGHDSYQTFVATDLEVAR
jgi:hypothetical protein